VKRFRIPGLIDKIEIDDPSAIAEIVANTSVDREFFTSTSLFNWFLIRRTLSALTVNSQRPPAMLEGVWQLALASEPSATSNPSC
jgi:hypothetical protein